MTRSIFAIATIAAVALSGAAFTTTADACISCEYVPEVVRQHATVPDALSYRSRSYAVRNDSRARVRRASRQRHEHAKPLKSAKAEKPERSGKLDTPRKADKRVRTLASKSPRLGEKIGSRGSPVQDVATVAVVDETSAGAIAPDRNDVKRIENESSSIALGAVQAVRERVSVVATPLRESAAKPSDCKKFFPSVAMTLTVPCE